MAAAFTKAKFDIKPVLRLLFNSDFFKNARYQHLKSPAEVVVGTLRLVGGYERMGAAGIEMNWEDVDIRKAAEETAWKRRWSSRWAMWRMALWRRWCAFTRNA